MFSLPKYRVAKLSVNGKPESTVMNRSGSEGLNCRTGRFKSIYLRWNIKRDQLMSWPYNGQLKAKTSCLQIVSLQASSIIFHYTRAFPLSRHLHLRLKVVMRRRSRVIIRLSDSRIHQLRSELEFVIWFMSKYSASRLRCTHCCSRNGSPFQQQVKKIPNSPETATAAWVSLQN